MATTTAAALYVHADLVALQVAVDRWLIAPTVENLAKLKMANTAAAKAMKEHRIAA